MERNILFICGSLNQTMILHKIATQLPEYHCYFTPFYADGLMGWLSAKGFLDFTILGGNHRRNTESYLQKEGLPVDFGGKARVYDAFITGTDLIVQRNVHGSPLILIQEGITEAEDWVYRLVRTMRLPRWLANTAATGLSNAYDVFCVASSGYRDFFIQKGIKPEKLRVTGIPNFDDAEFYLVNDFPQRHYALAATSSIRETLKWDNRIKFILEAKRIAAGRDLIFKLHPNENIALASYEIRKYAPEAQIFTQGNTQAMIANCDVLITQVSSVVYTGIALGKEVYSYHDVDLLRRLSPIQNGGTSAQKIAAVCRQVIEGRRSEPDEKSAYAGSGVRNKTSAFIRG
jgi:hypothetical protein